MIKSPTKAKMFAFAVAMNAKRGDLELEDVRELRELAETQLERNDPLRKEILSFVTAFELRPDRATLFDMGTELFRAVEVAAMPDPVDAGRRDVNG